ncbi:MAG: hypothetical protein K2O71_07120, partial [Lachnospiraceae bacterium]|nr:hypothetical protein [Lachnospiraceae bacterium]
LTVEDLPDGVGKAYAKFHDNTLNAGSYMLSLFDGYDAMMAMEEALTAAGEDLSGIEYQAVEATVYEKDEEGDYYPLDEMQGITLICSLPENFAKHSNGVQITAVDANGALCRIDSKIVSVNGKDCVMFDLSVFTTYAILYKQSGTLTSGRQPTPTPTPVEKKTDTNTAPTISKTPTPTSTPQKTPTPKPAAPTSAPAKEEKTPTRVPANKPTSAPAQTATKTPTKAPAKTNSAPVRDKTPQTGDFHAPERYFAMLAAGSTLAGFGIWIGHKRK